MLASQPGLLTFRDSRVAEECLEGGGLFGPDRAMAGGGWPADSGPSRRARSVAVSPGLFRPVAAERFGRVAEPAVVGRADVQACGLRAEQVLHSTVGVQHRRLRRGALPNRSVYAGERRDEVASNRPGGDLSGLELPERVNGQVQVVFLFQFPGLGVEQGL